MTQKDAEHLIPFSILGSLGLVAAALLLSGAVFIEAEIFRYYSLGAGTACLVVTAHLFALTKFMIWPARIVLRKKQP